MAGKIGRYAALHSRSFCITVQAKWFMPVQAQAPRAIGCAAAMQHFYCNLYGKKREGFRRILYFYIEKIYIYEV